MTTMHVDKKTPFVSLVKGLALKKPSEIMNAIYKGVLAAYQTNTLPYAEVSIPAVSPYVLGQYMMWQMLMVMYLAELMHVDAFDQPNVEDYKKVTKAILESRK